MLTLNEMTVQLDLSCLLPTQSGLRSLTCSRAVVLVVRPRCRVVLLSVGLRYYSFITSLRYSCSIRAHSFYFTRLNSRYHPLFHYRICELVRDDVGAPFIGVLSIVGHVPTREGVVKGNRLFFRLIGLAAVFGLEKGRCGIP